MSQSGLTNAGTGASSKQTLGLVVATVIGLIGSAIALGRLYRSVDWPANPVEHMYYLLLLAVVVCAWRALSTASGRKDFPAACILAPAFIFIAWYLSDDINGGAFIRFQMYFKVDHEFYRHGIGAFIYRGFSFDALIVVTIASLMAGWKLHAAK